MSEVVTQRKQQDGSWLLHGHNSLRQTLQILLSTLRAAVSTLELSVFCGTFFLGQHTYNHWILQRLRCSWMHRVL
ncbi:hypothetical protein [Pseudomonas syringae group sp. J248-6]|uniref:hypothetical protein n=1 Tax=Pseudomonas syringae group sp. J248-6 TaxID=3079590 RepID=UPI0029087F80|nr:hypothetical protein [Pseudomonas syringae group sp. J248-6]MDU8542522.1 hypothetical protein [Pseudomonas syringae group sp. J248-6]